MPRNVFLTYVSHTQKKKLLAVTGDNVLPLNIPPIHNLSKTSP